MSASVPAVGAAADFIAPLHEVQSQPGGPAGPASFGSLVSDGLRQVNDGLLAGEADLQALALGDAGNLHQVMIRLEQTRLEFQLAMQVRNRVLEAYQDIMKMQV